MNFYSVDGSSYDNQVYQNFNNMSIETFENTEYNNSSNSDEQYQCSDKFGINGESIISVHDISVDACKKSCVHDINCMGFDYDNDKKSCNIYKGVTSLDKENSNGFFCVKKDGKPCNNLKLMDPSQIEDMEKKSEDKVYKSVYEDLLNKYSEKLDSLRTLAEQNEILSGRFSELEDELKNLDGRFKENKILSTEVFENKNLANLIKSENDNLKNEIKNFSNKEKELKDKLEKKCDKENIYVDLECFLTNMDNLKNHANNMMIDLGVLISNIKSCSYVAKNKDLANMKKMDESKPTNNALDILIGNIEVPKPVQINLPGVVISEDIEDNMKDIVNMGNRIGNTVGIIGNNSNGKESFQNVDPEFDFKWFSSDLLIVVVIVFILYFIIFQRKKN